jgi:hypothetical protein
MSFEEYDECFLWRCDECGHEVAFKPHDFFACVAELKARGWGFAREPEGWRHWVPAPSKEFEGLDERSSEGCSEGREVR